MIKKDRDEKMKQNVMNLETVETYKKLMEKYNTNANTINNTNNKDIIDKYERKINDMMKIIHELTTENGLLKGKLKSFEI